MTANNVGRWAKIELGEHDGLSKGRWSHPFVGVSMFVVDVCCRWLLSMVVVEIMIQNEQKKNRSYYLTTTPGVSHWLLKKRPFELLHFVCRIDWDDSD